MFTPLQIVLIACAALLIQLEMNNSQQFIKCFGEKVFTGLMVGIIMGDYKTGLLVGGTFELMALGVSGLGGSSVPNYLVGTAVGTAFAIATGQGLDVALVAGIPTATLGTSLDVVAKMAGSYWLHRVEKLVDKGKFESAYRTVMLANVVGGRIMIANVLPIILYLVLGSFFIESFISVIPTNVINSLSSVGHLLPALGMAILMNYLPVKHNVQYLILGFVAVAYLNLPILGVALIGTAAAIIVYQQLCKEQASQKQIASAGVQPTDDGGLGDE